MQKTILSIQSHVAFGYVGNRAAVFPLQRLGHDVMAVNTVQFSNHTGYGAWRGEIFSPEHITDLLTGLEERGALDGLNVLLTGYIGSAALGAVVVKAYERLKAHNPNMIWCCDPVMGDVGRGFFVQEGIPGFFQSEALHRADILTPNMFELSALSGFGVTTRRAAHDACRRLHEQGGPEMILVTSFTEDGDDPQEIEMLLSLKSGALFSVATPNLPLVPPPNGAGDATAALFTGYLLKGLPPEDALAQTAEAVFSLFEATQASGRRELAMTAAQNAFTLSPAPRFPVRKVG